MPVLSVVLVVGVEKCGDLKRGGADVVDARIFAYCHCWRSVRFRLLEQALECSAVLMLGSRLALSLRTRVDYK